MQPITDEQLQQFLQTLSPAQYDEFMRDMLRVKKTKIEADELQQYQTEDGIVKFAREVIGADVAPYQEKILRALVKHRRVAVRGPRRLGKTAVASWVVLWGMSVFATDVKIPTIAGVFRQLEKFLWPEVRKWSKNLKDRSFRVLQMALKGDNKEAFAMTSDDSDLLEGAHASVIIMIFDESKAIPESVFDAAEGSLMGAGEDTDSDAYVLMLSTPGNMSGRFYEIHAHKPGFQDWHTIHVKIEEVIAAGRVSKKRVEDRRDQWGEESAPYKNYILGEFDDSGEQNLIPLSWIEQAHERYYQLSKEVEPDAREAIGADPAGSGKDKAALARLKGRVITMEYHPRKNVMQFAGRIAATCSKEIPIGVDHIGIGAGTTHRLEELGYNAKAVNVSSAAKFETGDPMKDMTDTFEFYNLRSWIWWHLRDMLNPDNPDAIALPPFDDSLIGDLCTPTYEYLSNGKIKVESKVDIKKRLKRSTDGADAVALALYMDYLEAYRNRKNKFEYRKVTFRNADADRLRALSNYRNWSGRMRN